MIELTIDKKDIERIAAKLSKLSVQDQSGALYSGFVNASLLIENALKQNISGTILSVRTGRLKSSIGSMVESRDNALRAIIGSGVRQRGRVKYANIHETGGTIRPVNVQFLTIPLTAAKTAGGASRFTARDVMEKRTKYLGSFIRNDIIFGVIQRKRKGSPGKIVPLFVLKTSVDIPARRYMSVTMEQNSQGVVDIILAQIGKVLNE